MTRVDSSVPLMHHDPDRSWIADPNPEHPKGMHPSLRNTKHVPCFYRVIETRAKVWENEKCIFALGYFLNYN